MEAQEPETFYIAGKVRLIQVGPIIRTTHHPNCKISLLMAVFPYDQVPFRAGFAVLYISRIP